MQKLTCPRGGVTHLTFSPDGDLLAGLIPPTLTRNPRVQCWTRSRDWAATGVEHRGPLTGLAFHPSGRTLAYAGISNSFWNPQPQPPAPRPVAAPPTAWHRRLAKETPRPFTGVHFYPLGEIDEFVPNRAYVPWEGDQAPRPDTWARGLAFTPDGRFMLAADVRPNGLFGSQVGVFHWHFNEGDGVWMLTETTAARGDTANGAALIGGWLALAGEWGCAACPLEPTTAELFVPDVTAARAVAAAPRGELVATGDGAAAFVWSLRGRHPLATVSTAHGAPSVLAFAPDGRTLAVGHASGVTVLADTATGAVQAERDFGVGWVTALAFAPDGLTLAVGGGKGAVVVDAE